MPPAVIAGGIAAAGAIGGAVIGAKAQKSAASQANAAQQEATQSQLQLGRESMDLNRDIYNSNYSLLSPFVSRGNVAGNAINALLGLGSAPVMRSPLAGTTSGITTGGAAPAAATPAPLPRPVRPTIADLRGLPRDQRQDARADYRSDLAAYRASLPGHTSGGATGGAGSGAGSAQQAFENFANSAGMQFQLKTAQDAINNGYAGAGSLQSGAAMKEISDRSQDIALNNYFLPYMGLLSGQQAVGAQSGAAVAGVGSNFGNTAANINANMGNAIQGGANSASAAAIARGNANAQMWGGIGSALGSVASSFVPTGGSAPINVYNANLPIRY